ncbi:MAG: hypothetical protein BWY63_02367 [Chloroflexi bacterium ADurb.Bin360]|nr:MAG: hypothetical protein BWY63_02367 [Chloroflexi bacterium ADurb.Bin360]
MHFTAESQGYLVVVGTGKIGVRLALFDTFLEHPIHSLTGTLHQPAPCKDFGNTAIARRLPPQDVLYGDPRQKPTGTCDFQPARKLPHENRAGQAIVTMAHCIQKRLADRDFIKSGYIYNEKPCLEVLTFITQVNLLP